MTQYRGKHWTDVSKGTDTDSLDRGKNIHQNEPCEETPATLLLILIIVRCILAGVLCLPIQPEDIHQFLPFNGAVADERQTVLVLNLLVVIVVIALPQRIGFLITLIACPVLVALKPDDS